MKNKLKSSSKQLKDMGSSRRKMLFIKREVDSRFDNWKDIYDHFRHTQTGIVLVRHLTVYTDSNGNLRQYISWLCPELGGGTANPSYWIKLAGKKN